MTFTNLVYSEFDTTSANLLADIRNVLLTCASVSRPNAAGKPDLYKITTTRGADIIFDLADAANDHNKLSAAAWRSHDGTTGAGKLAKYLWWRASGGGSTNSLHVVVSVSKEHIFISIEGPRIGEVNPMNANIGSHKAVFAMCDLIPYHEEDLVPVVVCIAPGQNASPFGGASTGSFYAHASKNHDGSISWDIGILTSMQFPMGGMSSPIASMLHPQRFSRWDNKYYLDPYRWNSNTDGPRGRLLAFHYAGMNVLNEPGFDAVGPVPTGAKTTIDGQLYRVIQVYKTGDNQVPIAGWGQCNPTTSQPNVSHLIGIPCT